MLINFVDFILVCLIGVVYAWTFYNIPILVSGIRSALRARQLTSSGPVSAGGMPSFSVVVPVKDEAIVVERLFETIQKLTYPKEQVQVVLVEDGSTDNTLALCRQFEASRGNVVVLQRSVSNGKPSALNFALQHCTGDFIAVFDADNVLASDALVNVAKYFEDPAVAAVQGRNLSINPCQNMLTQFTSYEESAWCEAYLRGKDSLGLFVHLRGSCQFIRRQVLEAVGGFDEATLSEDMELSARLTERGFRLRYGGDVCAWQESPSTLSMLLRQRTRWFRGTMEVAAKYGSLMGKPSLRNVDAEITLITPFIIIASLLGYVVGSGAFFVQPPYDLVWRGFVVISLVGVTLTLAVVGAALMFLSKSKGVRNVLWLPFVFGYWSVQGFIALYALLLIVFRRPKRWVKTQKNGASDGSCQNWG